MTLKDDPVGFYKRFEGQVMAMIVGYLLGLFTALIIVVLAAWAE